MSARGFTLFELLVVLGILAMALTLAVPRISQALPGQKVRDAAQELAVALRSARGQALAKGRDTVLVLNLADRRFETVEGDDRAAVRLPDGLSLAVLDENGSPTGDDLWRIRFFAEGGASGGRISVSLGERRRIVSVDWVTGRVRIGNRTDDG